MSNLVYGENMKKGNLVRIKPAALITGFNKREFRLRSSHVQRGENPEDNVLCGSYPMTEEERSAWHQQPGNQGIDSAGEPKLAPLSKSIPLDASVYLLERSRVAARGISWGHAVPSMALIRNIETGEPAYVEREIVEPINPNKKFSLRYCVVRKRWNLDKA